MLKWIIGIGAVVIAAVGAVADLVRMKAVIIVAVIVIAVIGVIAAIVKSHK